MTGRENPIQHRNGQITDVKQHKDYRVKNQTGTHTKGIKHFQFEG